MTNYEIYDLAGNVISSIANDLQNGIYDKLNGELSIIWSEERSVNAWAESSNDINKPACHKIGFTYELVRQIYRDIESYCKYIECNIDNKLFETLFQDDAQPLNLLATHFSKEAYTSNMFIGAITWIFFHELGHLNQEHGYIRNVLNGTTISSIHECNINTKKLIKGKESAISHVTELAADFEAVHFCILELIRQFKGDNLKPSIFIFMCGISCVLYRFHGANPFIKEEVPIGSHPNPLIRLENMVPQIYEYLSIPALHKVINIELSRESLVKMCQTASTTVGLFWLKINYIKPKISDIFFLMGPLNRPGMISYLSIIIKTWDEIEPTIKTVRRTGTKLGLLNFTEELRTLLNNIPNYDNKNKVILLKYKPYKCRRKIIKRVIIKDVKSTYLSI